MRADGALSTTECAADAHRPGRDRWHQPLPGGWPNGYSFAGWVHLFTDVLSSDGRTTPWYVLLVTGAVIGDLNAWTARRAKDRSNRKQRPDAILWAVVSGLAVLLAFLAEPAWSAVAGVYTVATAVIAVIDVRRVKGATSGSRTSPWQVLHR